MCQSWSLPGHCHWTGLAPLLRVGFPQIMGVICMTRFQVIPSPGFAQKSVVHSVPRPDCPAPNCRFRSLYISGSLPCVKTFQSWTITHQLPHHHSLMTVTTITRKQPMMHNQRQQDFFRRLDRALATRYVQEYLGLQRERRSRIAPNDNQTPQLWQPRYVAVCFLS
jgi:hypothetical protein